VRRYKVRSTPFLTIGLLWLILLVFAASISAQAGGFTPFAWEDADLALLIPPQWTAATVLQDDQSALELRDDESTILVLLLPDATTDEALRPALEAALRQLGIGTYQLAEVQWLGRSALGVASSGDQNTDFGRVGRLPDGRVLVMAGHNLPESTWNAVANSLVFSASSAPTAPTYSLVWRAELPENAGEDTPVQIAGLAYSPLGQLYAVEATQGVLVYDPRSGAYLVTYPFINPSQPTSIAVDGSGAAYVADITCRCLQTLVNRVWREPLGAFGGGAPFEVDVAPDGSLYAVDRTTNGFSLRLFRDGNPLTIPLNFNGAAAPLVAVDGSSRVTIIEWLSSLIDGDINGAVSTLEDRSTSLHYWLDIAPDAVSDAVMDATDHLVVALADGRVALVGTDGSLFELVREDSTPRALTFGPDGTLFVAREDGSIVARSANAAPERTGDGTVVNDVPVQGTLNESVLRQEWRYAGTAGEQITISAVDLTRTDALDMSLRLIGPDGGELAVNDDQLGLDLYGRFDAQIADQVLRAEGTYTIVVEWVRGAGTYTLGVSANRRFELSADSAAHLEGALQDVFPVQRWVFEGRSGQVVTFTMFAESGDLDPALEVIQPGGTTLAYNDDADDPELGINPQLFRVELPDDGIYVLEASRFEGSGRYSIVALVNG
jgi:DNA-binding beta-propeller fold protein YncE